ncbi:MAG: hypothetical protein WC551_07240 [Patescibacteria group bacterium]
MNILKNAYKLTLGQRKILAVLTIAVALTNSQVSAARAADPEIQAVQPIYTLITPVDISTDTVSTKSEPVATKPSVQEVLIKVCEGKGYGEDCAKTLLGMLWNESSNRFNVIGDSGKARGYFQIHYKLHKISIACAEDLVCSANWTIDYLERNSYPRYVNYAVQCHNSCNVANGYAAKAFRNGNIFWNKPLEVKQDAPIELAMK